MDIDETTRREFEPDARQKLDEYAEMQRWDKNKPIGWSEAADFAEWCARQKCEEQRHQCGMNAWAFIGDLMEGKITLQEYVIKIKNAPEPEI